DDLGRREIVSVLVEGGGEVVAGFLSEERVNRVCLFVAARFLGPGAVPVVALPSGAEPRLQATWPGLALESISLRRAGPDLVVEGRPAPVRRGKEQEE